MLAYVRAHPIRTAAIVGSILGLINAVALEIDGILHGHQHGVLILLAPFYRFGIIPTEQTALQAAFILFIEFAANILADALLFAVPVALVVGIVRIVRTFRR
jgi:hypothetical protein